MAGPTPPGVPTNPDHYQSALKLADASGRNVWAGFQAFLVASTLLFGFMVQTLVVQPDSVTRPNVARLLLAAAGVVLCIVWFLAARRLWSIHLHYEAEAARDEPDGWNLLSAPRKDCPGPIRTKTATYLMIGVFASGFAAAMALEFIHLR